MTRYSRLSAALPADDEELDGFWNMYASQSSQALSRPPPVVAVDESIWKLTHVIDDPAERIVVVMPRKPAGIGALAYLFAVKLLYSELPFCVV